MRRLVIVLVLVCMLFTPWTSVAGVWDEESGTEIQIPAPSFEKVMGSPVDLLEIRIPLAFGDIGMEEVEGYTMLSLGGAIGQYMMAGAPVLPTYGDILSFPVNTRIDSVSLEDQVSYRTSMDDKVVPGPEPIPIVFGSEPIPLYEGDVYTTDKFYPETDLDWRVTTGSNPRGGIEAHLLVRAFPLRYNPVSDELIVVEKADLVVRFELPDEEAFSPMDRAEKYEILVLCPQEFFNESLRYKDHKETIGWSVKVVSLDNVYDDSIFNTSLGRDDPERIKYFIKQAIENWTVEHVLLIGDAGKFPIRYTRIEDGADGASTPSDFYFGDVFKQGTTEFSDWNSDDDGFWGESRSGNPNADGADLDGDVTVGRLPASTVLELEKMINKTINYHKAVTAPGSEEWFGNYTLIGTDTFGGSSGGISEGEFAVNAAAQYMTEFDQTRFFESTGSFVKQDIEDHLNRGTGFASWSDHGNYGGVVWTSGGYGPGISSTVAKRLTNGDKLFLSIQDACLTNGFDTSDSLGENMVLNPDGGGIGAIGSTRIGWGMWDQWHTQGLSGYMGVHLIEMYSDGHIMPGVMLDETRRNYLVDWGMNWPSDMKTLAAYSLIGDPVTFLGGPGIDFESETTEVWAAPGDVINFDITIRNKALHDDDINISILGGAWDWQHNLTKPDVTMASNDTINISLSVTVDDRALAYDTDSVTFSVDTLGIPFPIEQLFSVHVIEIRSVDVDVAGLVHPALPGDDVTINFSIVNDGNIQENATAWFHGDHGSWIENITQEGIVVDAWGTFDGNVSFKVPTDAVAGNYYFELRVDTENGTTEAFFIKIEVGVVHELDVYAWEDSLNVTLWGSVPGKNVEFEIFIDNMANHEEDMLYMIEIIDRPDGPDTHWRISFDIPDDITLTPFSGTTEVFEISFEGEILAGDYKFLLTVSSSCDVSVTKDIILTVAAKDVSNIGITAVEEIEKIEGGLPAVFDLAINSASNFEEDVAISVDGLPSDWTWKTDTVNLTVDAFQDKPFKMTFTPLDDLVAGDYEVEVRATGRESSDTVTLTITVDEARALDISLDKERQAVYITEGTTFMLTINNTGNTPDDFMVKAASTGGLMVRFEKDLVALDPHSAGDSVKVMVDVVQGTPEGDIKFTIEVFSVHDMNVRQTVDAVIEARERFVPKQDLKVISDGMSTLRPGDSGSFTIILLNLGNIEENINVSGQGNPWDVEHPENITIDVDNNGSVIATYVVPKGTGADTYSLCLVLEHPDAVDPATSLTQNACHTVKVVKAPKEALPLGGTSSILPLLLIAIIVVLAILLAIAWGRRSKGGTEVPPPPASSETYSSEEPSSVPESEEGTGTVDPEEEIDDEETEKGQDEEKNKERNEEE